MKDLKTEISQTIDVLSDSLVIFYTVRFRRGRVGRSRKNLILFSGVSTDDPGHSKPKTGETLHSEGKGERTHYDRCDRENDKVLVPVYHKGHPETYILREGVVEVCRGRKWRTS